MVRWLGISLRFVPRVTEGAGQASGAVLTQATFPGALAEEGALRLTGTGAPHVELGPRRENRIWKLRVEVALTQKVLT